jgi:hypothetical protein
VIRGFLFSENFVIADCRVLFVVSIRRKHSEERVCLQILVDGAEWENRSHRGWTTLASFGLQGLLATGLLLLPLLYTQVLPRLHLMGSGLLSPPPGPAPVAPHLRHENTPMTSIGGHGLMVPSHIPSAITTLHDGELPPAPRSWLWLFG